MMNSQPPVEEMVRSLYQAPQAEQQFLDSLGRRLDKRAVQLATTRRRPGRRWWIYAGSVALLVALGWLAWQPVARAIGPLFGYDFIEGVGLVPTEGVRTLAAPVAQIQGTEILMVTQLVTSAEGTRLWYRLEGADRPLNELALDPAWLETPDQQKFEPTNDAFSARVDRDSGAIIVMQTFPPLPPEATQVSFYAAPDWHIRLELRSATEAAQNLMVLYPDACQTDHAVRLCVTTVALADEGIYLVVQSESTDPNAFRFELIGDWNMERITLVDDLGHQRTPTYLPNLLELGEMAVEEPAASEPPDGRVLIQEALTFEPVPKDATILTLHIPAFSGRKGERMITQKTLTIDLGEAPQVGDTFEIDLRMTIRGIEVVFDQAEIIDDPNGVMVLLTSRPLDEIKRCEVRVVDVSLPDSSAPGNTSRTTMTGGCSVTGEMQIGFDIEHDDGSLQGGTHTFTVRLEAVDVVTVGPFEITWAVPSAEQ